MGMSIRTNSGGNNSCRILKKTSKKNDSVLEKLASGYQINKAGDDASGLAITEKMRAQITALETYSDNSENGISLIQTAEGYLGEVHDMLDRMYELCIRAGDGIFEDNERKMIQEEVNQLNDEIDRISDTANFNGNKLFDANYKWVTTKEVRNVIYYETIVNSNVQTTDVIYTSDLPNWMSMDSATKSSGVMSDTYTDQNGKKYVAATLDFSDFKPSDIANSIGKGFYTTCCTCPAHYSIEFTDEETTPSTPERSGDHYIYKVSLRGCVTGDDVINRIINATGGRPNGHFTNLEKIDGKLVIRDNRDYETYTWAKPDKQRGYGLFGSGVAVESKTTQKNGTIVVQKVKQEEVSITNLMHTDRVISINAGANKPGKIYISLPEMSASTLDTKTVNVLTADNAGASTNTVKNAINTISMERANLGAQQNRLEYTIDDLDNAAENISAAKSRIKDTDMADMMIEHTKNNILQQSAQAMLAQANTQAQSTISLLQ